MADSTPTPTDQQPSGQMQFSNQAPSHTVAAGDTLSAIGQKYGVNWQDLYQANKSIIGQNPNIIRPGMVLKMPYTQGQSGTSTGSTGNTTDFKLDIPSTVDSKTVKDALTNPITQQDLEDAVAKNKNLTTSITDESNPSQKETNLGNQIAEIKAKEEQEKIALQKYENALPQEGISEFALRGRSGAMARDVNLDIQTLVSQEKALAAELGVEVKSRTGQLAADKASFANNEKVISDYNTMQRLIDTQKNQVQTQANKLTSDAKSTLNTILTHFKDTTWENLTPDTQKQLTDLAANAGVPLEILQAGMKANANQAKLNQIKQTNEIIRQRQVIAKGSQPPIPKGTIQSGNLKVSPSDMSDIGTTLEHGSSKNGLGGRGGDGYANTQTYLKLYQGWINNGGLPQDFTKHFPPKSYLNPNDATVPWTLGQQLKTPPPK